MDENGKNMSLLPEKKIKLSIIIPVYNERKTIEEVLEKVSTLPVEKEIIVVDDGSKDGTRELLQKISSEGSYPEVSILFHEINKGKGSAIRTALKYVKGEIICIQDADLEYEPIEFLQLLKGFEDSSVDAVYGSRFLKENPVIYKTFLWGNKFLTFLINLLFGANFSDSYTCYKLIKRDIIKKLNLKSNRFEIEGEISIKLAKNKCKIIEFPISYRPRKIKEGKKIGLKDALRGIFTILKFKFKD